MNCLECLTRAVALPIGQQFGQTSRHNSLSSKKNCRTVGVKVSYTLFAGPVLFKPGKVVSLLYSVVQNFAAAFYDQEALEWLLLFRQSVITWVCGHALKVLQGAHCCDS
jgi:hypothetical protein